MLPSLKVYFSVKKYGWVGSHGARLPGQSQAPVAMFAVYCVRWVTAPRAPSLQYAASLCRRRSPSVGRYCQVVESRALELPSLSARAIYKGRIAASSRKDRRPAGRPFACRGCWGGFWESACRYNAMCIGEEITEPGLGRLTYSNGREHVSCL
jgi:hypothetical protein